jgi:hypothetical protein
MDVIGFLCVSLGSSTVHFHDSLGSRSTCSCSERLVSVVKMATVPQSRINRDMKMVRGCAKHALLLLSGQEHTSTKNICRKLSDGSCLGEILPNFSFRKSSWMSYGELHRWKDFWPVLQTGFSAVTSGKYLWSSSRRLDEMRFNAFLEIIFKTRILDSFM